MPANWRFFLTGLDGTVQYQLLNASERTLTLPLQRIPTCSFKLRMSDVAATDVLGVDRLVKVYRNSTLVFFGPILSVEENADAQEQSLMVNAVGSMWRLQHRLLGNSVTGTTWFGSRFTDIAQDFLVQAGSTGGARHPGITIGTVVPSPVIASLAVGPIVFKPVLEALAEMGASAQGYEFEVVPVEPSGAFPNTVIGQLNLAYPRIGADKPNAIFEYGTPKANVLNYKRTYSMDGILTRAYSIVNGNVVFGDGTSAEPTRGCYEGWVPIDLQDSTSSQDLINEHALIRKDPRLLIVFEPFVNATPEPLVDVSVGDTIRFRAPARGIDVNLRVWGITFNIDNAGSERVQYELVQP